MIPWNVFHGGKIIIFRNFLRGSRAQVDERRTSFSRIGLRLGEYRETLEIERFIDSRAAGQRDGTRVS